MICSHACPWARPGGQVSVSSGTCAQCLLSHCPEGESERVQVKERDWDRERKVEVAHSNFVYGTAKLFKQNSQVATHSGSSLDSIMRASHVCGSPRRMRDSVASRHLICNWNCAASGAVAWLHALCGSVVGQLDAILIWQRLKRRWPAASR